MGPKGDTGPMEGGSGPTRLPLPHDSTFHVTNLTSSTECEAFCHQDDAGHKYSFWEWDDKKCFCMFDDDSTSMLVKIR